MRENSTSRRRVSTVVLAVVAALACASVAMAHDHSSGALVARQQHQNIHQHHKFVLKARQTRDAGSADGTDAGNGGSDGGDQSAQQPNGSGASAVSSSSSSASSSRTFLLTSTPPSASSNTQIASQTSQPGNLISNIGNGLSSALNIPSTSSGVLSQSTAASTSLSQTSAVNSVSSAASSSSSNTAAQPTVAANSDSVENVTLYSTVSAPTTSATIDEAAASASAAAAQAAKKKEDESSGLGKSTIIIIVVVASCIGGAIAIWTIIRKIKLSPSSRFNRKLAPIDFNAGRRDSDIYGTVGQGNFATVGSTSSLGHANSSNNLAGAEAWPVHRSPSMSDEGHGYANGGLSRQPSSGAGALLGSRSGSPEGKSDLGHNPAMSEVGYASFYPSLPPVSHNHNNIYGAPRDGYGAAPTSDYYNAGVGYSASMRRPNY